MSQMRKGPYPQMARYGNKAGAGNRKREPDQWQYCTGLCKEFLPPDRFRLNHRGTLDSWCDRCTAKASAFSWEKKKRRASEGLQ